MKRPSLRFLIPAFTLILLWLLATTVAQASPVTQADLTPTPVPPGVSIPGQEMPGMAGEMTASSVYTDCRECHWDIYLIWEESSHGQGLSCSQCHLAVSEDNNHARAGHGAQEGGSQECMACHTTGYDAQTDTWTEGNIHCTACHTPIPGTHPDDPAPTNRSADLCGECHIQANFEWQISTHGVEDVSCVDCHNQHRATLKNPVKEIAEQCSVCHEALEADFSKSMHAEQDISCAECHLAPVEDQLLGRGNARLNHTFEVDINACLQCHREMLHAPNIDDDNVHLYSQLNDGKSHNVAHAEELDAMASAVEVEVTASPPEANANSFMAFTMIFGVGAGVGAVSWTANLLYKGVSRLIKRKRK
jgi:hypothetical protein